VEHQPLDVDDRVRSFAAGAAEMLDDQARADALEGELGDGGVVISGVEAVAAIDRIVAAIAVKIVVAGEAAKHVVAGPAIDIVVAALAVDRVVAVVAKERVVAGA